MAEQPPPLIKRASGESFTHTAQAISPRLSDARRRMSRDLSTDNVSSSARKPKNHKPAAKMIATKSLLGNAASSIFGTSDQYDYLGRQETAISRSHILLAFLSILHFFTAAATRFLNATSVLLRFDSLNLICLTALNLVLIFPFILFNSKTRGFSRTVFFVSLLDIACTAHFLYIRHFGIARFVGFWDVVSSLLHCGLLVLARYQALLACRPSLESLSIGRHSVPSPSAQFLVLVVGSGGHTTELLKMMRDSEATDRSRFRRWIVTQGDLRSETEIKAYEDWRAKKRGNSPSGVWEIETIRRAREVHQGWLTVPYTTLLCCYDVYSIMRKTYPFVERGDKPGYPQPIITNGPGSGFIFVLVCFLMRFAGIIPLNRAQSIFIESIARVETLSMTGKLFYYTNIADFITVQHWSVAKRYNLHCEWMLAAREEKRDSTDNS